MDKIIKSARNMLYQINEAVEDILMNPIIDESSGEILNERLDEIELIQGSKEAVGGQVAMVWKSLNAELLGIDYELKRLKELKDKITKGMDRAEKIIPKFIPESVSNKDFEVKYTKSSSIELDEFGTIDDIPDEYIRIKKELDKAKLKKLLVLPSGVVLVQKTNLKIK
jgi:hypothetical protein